MNFAEKLRLARKEKALSQAALAEMADISTRTLQNYESGKRYPANMEITMKLARALSTTPENLLDVGESAVVEADSPTAVRQLRALVEGVTGLFAGGSLCEEDRDAAMEAIIAAYWQAKKENRKFSADSAENAGKSKK